MNGNANNNMNGRRGSRRGSLQAADNSNPTEQQEITQTERITARRVRIENNRLTTRSKYRQERGSGNVNNNVRKSNADIRFNEEDDMKQSLAQVQTSLKTIEEVKHKGNEQVTDIVIGVMSRESKRRQEEQNKEQVWVEKLVNEKQNAEQLQKELDGEWSKLKSVKNPFDLDKALKLQKESAEKVIQVKNKVIHEYMNELKIKDDEYVKEFKRQSEEIDALLEKMESQYRTFQTNLMDEMTKIESSYVQERRELLAANKKELESIMEKRRTNEKGFTDSKINNLETQHEDIENLRTQDSEEYNLLKIKLETDIQVLEQQLSQMRGTYQLNMEKLEYNYQVLKKREEENTIILASQKRRVTKLTDHLNSLRQKVTKQEKTFDTEFNSLTSDLKRMTEQYEELHKKYKHFQVADEIKYQEMKNMQESSIREVIRKLLQADKIIHEEQLSEQWKRPDNIALLKLLGLERPKKKAIKEGLGSKSNSVDKINGNQENAIEEEPEEDRDQTIMALKVKEDSGIMRQIFDIIAKEASFLIEDKLHDLLEPLSEDEQSLIKIDAIFKALGIKNIDDIQLLTENMVVHDGHGQEKLIESDEVIKALRKYTDERNSRSLLDEAAKKDSETALGSASDLNSESDASYWEALQNVIDDSTFEKWMFVYKAMKEYNVLLVERSNLIEQVLHFKNQNDEFAYLLQNYAHSNINKELCLPPPTII